MVRRLFSLVAGGLMILPAQATEPPLKASILVEDAPNASKQLVAYVTTQQPFEGHYAGFSW